MLDLNFRAGLVSMLKRRKEKFDSDTLVPSNNDSLDEMTETLSNSLRAQES